MAVAPSRFLKEMASKLFSRFADRELVLSDYRKAIGHGFSGLSKLVVARRNWGDVELEQFASTLREVECPHVTEASQPSERRTIAAAACGCCLWLLPVAAAVAAASRC